MKLTGGLQSTLRTIFANRLKTQQASKSFSQFSRPTRNIASTNTAHRHRAFFQPPQPLSGVIESRHRPYSSYTNSSSSSSPPQQTMTSPETASGNSSNSSNSSNTAHPETASNPAPPPALPALPAADGPSQTLEVGGAALRLDHLGPLVVNVDGTLSRVANWDKMADIERENTLRILGKRNQTRLAKLRAAKSEADGSAGGAARDTEER
ncbi:hypothetical protein F5Y14DRAFT_296326 [Nemania sp. NC0429]|nr:hypothetical protein F5Y14DRAFT_296326 [Nemania sp. NC0429]